MKRKYLKIFEDIVLPIAKEAGYEFTMSELKNAQRDLMAEKGISEEELENVSGGWGFCLGVGIGMEDELNLQCWVFGIGAGWY